MLLGRRLLQTPTRVDAQRVAPSDATLDMLKEHDRFFCDMMENIPPSFYFPTDAEANWKQSVPRKYHKNVQAQHQRESSKKRVLKCAKFSPAAQQSNEERQQSAAALEQQEKQQQQLPQQLPQSQALDKQRTPRDATNGADGLDGLRARLAVKIQTMRERRHAEEKTGQKRPSRAEFVAEQRSLKKRKSAANRSKANVEKRESGAAAASQAKGENQAEQKTDDVSAVDTSSISYGSLLLDEGLDKDKKTPVKTRHGQSVRGIQNLLKKAERNAQRLEELKKTEDGAEKVKAKGWDTALQLAAGKVVLDDPKLLRAKLKKEKTKAKSSKEWKERVAKLEVSTKERLKKKRTNALGRGKQETAKTGEKKGRKGPRAGFEGKKGEAFLNADKKGSKSAGKTSAALRK